MSSPWSRLVGVPVAYFAALVVVEAAVRRLLARQKTLDPKAAACRFASSCNAALLTALSSYFLVLERRAAADTHAARHALLGPGDGEGGPLSPLVETSLLLMMGYIGFDTLQDWLQGQLEVGIIAHHALGLLSELISLTTGCCGALQMRVQLAEASTPIMHLSWLFVKTGWKEKQPALYTAVGSSLLGVFAALRVVSPGFIVARFAGEATRKGFRYGEGDFLADAAYLTMAAITLTWWAINCYWFVLLLRIAFGKKKQVDSYDKTE